MASKASNAKLIKERYVSFGIILAACLPYMFIVLNFVVSPMSRLPFLCLDLPFDEGFQTLRG